MVHYTGPSFAGGVEVLVRDFLARATAHYHNVRLIVGREDGAVFQDVDVVRLPLLDASNQRIQIATQQMVKGEITSETVDLCDEIFSDLLQVVPVTSIVHAHNIITNSFNLPLVAAFRRLVDSCESIRLLAWCHDPAWGVTVREQYDFSRYPLELLVAPWPRTQYVVLRESLRDEMESLTSIPETQISVVEPYVDLRRILGLTDRVCEIIERTALFEVDVVILYACRMTARKNVEYAAQICHSVKRMGRSVRLLVTAPLSPHRREESLYYRNAVVDKLVEWKLCSEVVFLNDDEPGDKSNSVLTYEDMAALYRIVDVAIMTSHHEGFGLAVLEAEMGGVPVVVKSGLVPWASPRSRVSFEGDEHPDRVAELVISKAEEGKARRQTMLRYGEWETHFSRIRKSLAVISARQSA